MGARDDFLKENEERIKECEQNISALLASLGQKGVANSILFDIPAGRKLVLSCTAASKDRERAERKLHELRSATRTHEERVERLDENDKELKTTSAKLKELISSLGAIIYERCSASYLDRETFAPIYREFEANKRLFHQGTTKLFYKYGRLVLDLELDKALDGKALDIAQTIRKAEGRKEGLDRERKSLFSLVRANKQNPFFKDNAEKAEKEYNAKLEKETAALESYGEFLYDQSSVWINDETPDELFDVLEMILNERNRREALIKERRRLGREAEAYDYKALLEAEESKLSILKRERERIESDIAEAENKANNLRLTIERLNNEIKKGNRR